VYHQKIPSCWYLVCTYSSWWRLISTFFFRACKIKLLFPGLFSITSSQFCCCYRSSGSLLYLSRSAVPSCLCVLQTELRSNHIDCFHLYIKKKKTWINSNFFGKGGDVYIQLKLLVSAHQWAYMVATYHSPQTIRTSCLLRNVTQWFLGWSRLKPTKTARVTRRLLSFLNAFARKRHAYFQKKKKT